MGHREITYASLSMSHMAVRAELGEQSLGAPDHERVVSVPKGRSRRLLASKLPCSEVRSVHGQKVGQKVVHGLAETGSKGVLRVVRVGERQDIRLRGENVESVAGNTRRHLCVNC